MKKIMKYLTAFFVGVGIGRFVESILSLIFGHYIIGVPEFLNAVDPSYASLIQSLLYGGFGLVSAFGEEVFYKKLDLALAIQSLLHFGMIFSYFLFTGYILAWFSEDDIILTIGIFVLIYLVIWLAIYLSTKKNIEEINKKLNN